jgi:hypothetical protein
MNDMKLIPTYQMETPPERAMEWRDFEHLILSKWEELLNRTPVPTEPDMQEFLERYPSMVPCAYNIQRFKNGPRLESGHLPWMNGLISQPVLPSFHHHIPDFMWLSRNSARLEPVLIEIEAPSKRWWKANGDPTADLTQALGQITRWKTWFEDSVNVIKFKEMYGLEWGETVKRQFKPSYLLIYGREVEANSKPDLIGQRSHLAEADVDIMTYDRLYPDPRALQQVCMKVKIDKGETVFKAISVPATMTLKPSLARYRSRLSGLEEAINSNKHISPKRKEFLIRRLPYWNEWLKSPEKGIVIGGDEE